MNAGVKPTSPSKKYPMMVGQPPEFVKTVLYNILGELHGHGMGRHTSDEIENIGMSDLTALSDFLGNNPYLLGSEPTSYDATAYSYVAHAIQQDYDSRMKKFIKTLPNLKGYWERLTTRLYKAYSEPDTTPTFSGSFPTDRSEWLCPVRPAADLGQIVKMT